MPRLLIAFICLAITFGIGVLYVQPEYLVFQELNFNLKQKQIELQFQEEYLAKLRSISAGLEDNQENLSKINSALPDDPAVPGLFNFLQIKASQNGLVLNEVTLGSIETLTKEQIAADEQYKKIPEAGLVGLKRISIILSLTGSYDALKDFTRSLEKNARLFRIESFIFNTAELAEGEPMEFEVGVLAYSY